jgi:hypothetical protein
VKNAVQCGTDRAALDGNSGSEVSEMTARTVFSGMALMLMGVANAAIVAFDSAADPVYNSGWSNGQNGGYGLLPWQIFPSGGTFFVGDSNTNGFFGGPGINSAGRAWGIDAPVQGPTYPYFYRGIAATVQVGWVVSWDIDTGHIPPGAQVQQWGLGSIFLGLDGAATNYWFQDTNGRVGTAIPATDGGLHVEYMWTSATTAIVSVTDLMTSSNYTLNAVAPISNYYVGQAIAVGSINMNDMYFNNMKVVPEPSIVLAICAGALLVLRRRK